MRIISGSAKGRKLISPPKMRVRPTADRVKEALFNILANLVNDLSSTRVIDIFAGTGSLGLETLSRGAADVVFIDNHHQSAQTIKKNLEMLGFSAKSRVIINEAVTALHQLEKEGLPYGLIFLDPPYAQGLTEKVLGHLSGSVLVNDETIVVAEFSGKEQIPALFGPLQEFDRRVYGDTVLAFLSKSD